MEINLEMPSIASWQNTLSKNKPESPAFFSVDILWRHDRVRVVLKWSEKDKSIMDL